MSDDARTDPAEALGALIGFDALGVLPATGAAHAVDDGQQLLAFVVPPLRGLYRPAYGPRPVMIPNTPAALQLATRSAVRAMSMLNN